MQNELVSLTKEQASEFLEMLEREGTINLWGGTGPYYAENPDGERLERETMVGLCHAIDAYWTPAEDL